MDLRWDPLADIAEIRDRINHIVEESMRRRMPAPDASEPRTWAPRVDIWETDHSLVFEAELPGVARQDIEVEIEGDRLTIRGERKPAAGREFVRVERPGGGFHRSFAIGVPVSHGAAAAKLHDGVLEITLPKAGQPGARQVKVPVE